MGRRRPLLTAADLAPTRQPAARVGSAGAEPKSKHAVGERGGGVGVPLQDLLFHLKFQKSRHTLGLVRLIPDAFWCVHTLLPRSPHPSSQPLGMGIFASSFRQIRFYSISFPPS